MPHRPASRRRSACEWRSATDRCQRQPSNRPFRFLTTTRSPAAAMHLSDIRAINPGMSSAQPLFAAGGD